MPVSRLIGIYTDDGAETLCHLVPSIADAGRWIGCHPDTFYKSMHVSGVMRAKGYKLEIIPDDADIKTNQEEQKKIKLEEATH